LVQASPVNLKPFFLYAAVPAEHGSLACTHTLTCTTIVFWYCPPTAATQFVMGAIEQLQQISRSLPPDTLKARFQLLEEGVRWVVQN